jgi:hypothetical protein
MIWGKSDANKLLSGTIPLGGNSQYILGFNEPDLTGQANLTPQEAADLWYQIEAWVNQNHPGKKLVAPAPTYYGREWLTQFYNAFVSKYGRPPRLDALAAHCYAYPPSQWTECQTVIQWFETKVVAWNIPGGIWVTEYGFPADSCTGTSCNWTSAVTALNSFTDWLQTKPYVQRYAWFANRILGDEVWWGNPAYTTRLVQCPDHPNVNCTPGQLTPLGTAYAAQ